MKKLSAFLSVLMLCLSLALPALAEAPALPEINTAKLLGAWETELPEYGTIRAVFTPDGIGRTYWQDQETNHYAITAQNGEYAAINLEDGKYEVGLSKLEFLTPDHIRFTAEDATLEYKRVETSDATALSLSNPFLGKWEADIPSANAVVSFEFLADGSYVASMGGQSYPAAGYAVLDHLMVTFEGDELCEYTFSVVDENNIDVTENGQTARFVRVDE